MLPGIAGSTLGAIGNTAVATYIGGSSTGWDGSQTNTQTITGLDLGTGPFKIINIHWTWFGGLPLTLSSVTVDGGAATIMEQDSHSGGGTGLGAAIAIIQSASTSGDITCTFSDSLFFVGVRYDVFSVTGIQSTTPFDKEEVQGFNDTSVTDQINVPARGFLILCGTGSTNTDAYGMAFTGATEVYDASSNFSGRYGGAVYNDTTAETNRTIGLTMTDGSGDVDDSGVELIAVSFGP